MGVNRGLKVVGVCLVLLLAVISLSAQTAGTGALTGTVKDSSGAVIPNASVTAISNDTNQARTVMTGDSGAYTVPLLPPGKYRVKFEASGFKTVEVPSVTVVVAETGTMDRTLDVGAQTQVVTVESDVVAVQTTTSAIATDITAQTVTALPLTTRNYTQILGLSAGASSAVNNATALGKGSQNVAVNGAPATSNNYQMDGAAIQNSNGTGVTQENNGFSAFGIPSPDAIEEFKIQTSMFDAGYGRNAGANVNVVTKSGTNDYHGTLFEFFRNTDLNANDFFIKHNNANAARPVLNQNQFGGVFGGPIKKDKLFFFFSYQETRQKNGFAGVGFQSGIVLPPVPAGDRSNQTALRQALGAALSPYTQATSPAFLNPAACPTTLPPAATPVNGTTIATVNTAIQVACDGSNINQVAINILELKNPDGSYYIPSSGTPGNFQKNVTYTSPASYTEHQILGNFDYVINSKNTVSSRFYWASAPTLNSFSCNTGGLCVPDTSLKQDFINYDIVEKLTSILTNHIVNEVRFSLQRNDTLNSPTVPFTNSQVGVANVTPGVDIFDFMTVAGQFSIGGTGAVNITNLVTQWQAADQVSWTRGRNTFRFGGELDRNTWNWAFPSISQGNLTFNTFSDFLLGLPGCDPSVPTCSPTNPGNTNGSGLSNIFASGTTTSRSAPGGLYHYFKIPNASLFLQDDIKVSQRLTLNLGVRWDYFGFLTDRGGEASNFWPSLASVPGTTPATGTLAGFVVPKNFSQSIPVGVIQLSGNAQPQNSPQKLNFAPRLGFAWQPGMTDKLVIRAGAGFFYDRIPGNTLDHAAVQGIPYSATVINSGSANFYSSLAQPYSNTPLGWIYRWADPAALKGSGSQFAITPFMEQRIVTPVVYEYNLTVQYQVAPSWVVELGYVGLTGVHQAYLARPINQSQIASMTNPINANPATGFTGITTNTFANANYRVPILGFNSNGLVGIGTEGNIKSNDVQATVRKSFSHGLTMQASYTYVRAFTTQPSTNGTGGGTNFAINNLTNTRNEYALSTDYHPSRLAINYSYELPFGNHAGIEGKLLNGWSASGVTVLQNGTPMTLLDTRGGGIYGQSAASTAFFCPGMGPANVAASGSLISKVNAGLAGTGGYFNTAAFCAPGPSALDDPADPNKAKATDYGNVAPSVVLGPGQFNWDISIAKSTKVGGIREDGTLVFRTEFYNAFNHSQFSNPAGLNAAVGSFGHITTLSVSPRLIQFGLKYMF